MTPLNQGASFCGRTLQRLAKALSSRTPVSTESRSSALGQGSWERRVRGQVCFQGSAVDSLDILRHVGRSGGRNGDVEVADDADMVISEGVGHVTQWYCTPSDCSDESLAG